jgi:hypothetical protein
MKRLILALAATASLAAPLPAQTLSVLLPVISFPETIVTPSTKGCVTPSAAVCILQE